MSGKDVADFVQAFALVGIIVAIAVIFIVILT